MTFLKGCTVRTVHTPWQLAVHACRADLPIDYRAFVLRAHLSGMSAAFRRATSAMLSMIANDQEQLRRKRN
jgi:hypothetical protein